MDSAYGDLVGDQQPQVIFPESAMLNAKEYSTVLHASARRVKPLIASN